MEKAKIVPIFKKGDKNNAENYRPVSLTSITCTLLEHIVHSNMMNHLHKHNVLADVQHGFRKFRSCESQLIMTTHDFIEYLNNKQQIDAIFLDFSKAFDKVHHQSLLLKVKHYGIENNMFLWIKSFLEGRSQTVIIDGQESSCKRVLSGVPQGTVMGPLLFLIYINDIHKDLDAATTFRLFADDSLLYRTIKTPEDTEILQRDLNKLQEWEKKWRMEFHPKKCQVLKITNKKNKINAPYSIHSNVLEETNSVKYLGVTLDNKMNWNDHINNICKKANSTLGFLKRNIPSCPPNVKKKCYETYVRPSLEYCSSVWDPHTKSNIDKIEATQRRAARFINNNYNYEHNNNVMLKELGWCPLEERRAKNKVKILFKAHKDLIHIPLNHLKVKTRATRNSDQSYALPSSNINSHLHSFYQDTVRLWNSVPVRIKTSPSVDSFVGALNKITLKSQYSD